MRVRKNWLSLNTNERNTYLQAVLTLKNTIANPMAPVADRYSVYDMFVLIHQSIENLTTQYSGFATDGAHGFFHFLPWHRKFLLEFENALNNAVPGQNIAIPYWDWTDVAGLWSDILVDDAFGPNGVGLSAEVQTGYFAPTAPAMLPAWWPAGLTGWECIFIDNLTSNLIRNIDPMEALPNQATVQDLLLDDDFFAAGDLSDPDTYTGLWWKLESGPHNAGHNWFNQGPSANNAQMAHMYVSVNDPMFFLHHSNVDRLWAMWQLDGHMGAGPYTAPGISINANYGHDPAHLLFPWIGGAAGWSSPTTTNPNIDFPDFSGQPATSINDMLNHRSLGYAYDTEPVVGLALDRTGSMTGVTPDPNTGLPSTLSKWEVASTGVANFLGDCEAARQAGEVFVTAGVETFRTTGGANEFDKIFAPPSDVVRTSGTVSEANFNAATAGMTPSGGTPIAGALTDTENALVRAPYGGDPTGETRYMYILTDGNETAPPNLATLANPEFPDTIIFAAGFGVGNGWNGVDYGTITTITGKGKAAPVGVQQVFHGEDANVINKFYTNGVAAAIGYDPIIDPYAELSAGEYASVPFLAGPAERSFMLVVQGAPHSAEDWSYMLRSPNGDIYHDGDPGPFLITARRSGGRITVFFHRNGAEDGRWDGTWYLVVGYQRKELPRELKELQLGLNAYDPLLHSAAPLPLEGPHFAATKGALRKKSTGRMILMPKPRLRLADVQEKQSADAGVMINIYAKTSITSALYGRPKAPYAGYPIIWTLDLDRHQRRVFKDAAIRARVVRPDFHIGDAYLDLKTISLDERQSFVDDKTGRFNEVAFLATYEQRRPGAFTYVQEDLVFKQVDETRFQAYSEGTGYPGTYRVGLTVNATGYLANSDQSSPLRRIHNAESSLGLQLSERHSRPTWHWCAKDCAEITVTPQDRFGHLASPAKMPQPTVILNGREIASEHINDYSGTHRLRINFEAGQDAMVDPLGTRILSREVKIRIADGSSIKLPFRETLRASLRIGNQTLPVQVPAYVADPDSGKIFRAFDEKIFSVDPTRRVVFEDEDIARRSGFKLED